MEKITANNFEDIFIKLLESLKRQDIIAVRGLNTRELIDVNLELTNPFNNDLSFRDKSYYMYLHKEFMAYLSGEQKSEIFAEISKFWDTVKNKDDTINSNYGYYAFHQHTPQSRSQFNWAANTLLDDMHSRKSVINFNNITHKHTDNKDFVCTMYMQFLIRDNKLEAYAYMRSNDIIYGLSYDLPWFCFLQIMIWLSLKHYYINLKLGSYHHHALSMHIYEKNFGWLSEIYKLKK